MKRIIITITTILTTGFISFAQGLFSQSGSARAISVQKNPEPRVRNFGNVPRYDAFWQKISRSEDTRWYLGAQAYLEDFKVNDEYYPADFNQYQVDLASSFWPMKVWVVWTDYRSEMGDIYLQRLDQNMAPLGGNVRVNQDSIGQAADIYPAVACDSAGNALVVWQSGKWPYDKGQRFDAAGNRIGSNFKLFPDTVSVAFYCPKVAMAFDGRTAVSAMGYSFSLNRKVIMVQRYDASGNQNGPAIYVDALDNDKSYYTRCAIGGDRLVVAWWDNRNGEYDLYVRVYNQNTGVPITGAIQVTEPAATGVIYSYPPAVAAGDTGQFVLAWADQRNGNYDIFVQRYDCNGNPVGSNTMVNASGTSTHQYYPQIKYALRGMVYRDALISWLDESYPRSIKAREMTPDGSFYYEWVLVPGTTEVPSYYHQVGITYSTEGTIGYYIPTAWEDFRRYYGDIYCWDGNLSATSLKCNRDSLGSHQSLPGVAADSTGFFAVVWLDGRQIGSNTNFITVKPFNANGTPASPTDIIINDTLVSYQSNYPAIAINATGKFVILWSDYKAITGQVGKTDFGPIGFNFRISADTTYLWKKSYPAVACDDSGKFLAAWVDSRTNYYDLYCRGHYPMIAKERGSLLSYDLRLNPKNGSVYGFQRPGVADLGQGRFVVVWQDSVDNQTILGRMVELGADTMILVGDTIRISDEPAGMSAYQPGVASMPGGDFCVAWYDFQNYNVKARWYNRNGVPYGPSFNVSDNNSYPDIIRVAIDRQGRAIITWQQNIYTGSGEHYDVMARAYNADRTPYTDVFRVNNLSGNLKNQKQPSVAAAAGKFYFVWEDARYDTCGTDIFAKAFTWEELGVASGQVAELKVPGLKLLPNAPNPFNKYTNIKFQIHKSGPVSLKVYNVAGQCVKTLVSEFRVAGSYEVRWDGRDERGREVAGGVYLYRLATNEGTASGRMTVVR